LQLRQRGARRDEVHAGGAQGRFIVQDDELTIATAPDIQFARDRFLPAETESGQRILRRPVAAAAMRDKFGPSHTST